MLFSSPRKFINIKTSRCQSFYTSISPTEHRIDIQYITQFLVLQSKVSESVVTCILCGHRNPLRCLFKMQILGWLGGSVCQASQPTLAFGSGHDLGLLVGLLTQQGICFSSPFFPLCDLSLSLPLHRCALSRSQIKLYKITYRFLDLIPDIQNENLWEKQ